MGNCGGSQGGNLTKEERERQKQIEDGIRKDKKRLTREVKLLLLGAGESGKSTIAKQMKIIHLKGFSEDERKSYKDIIHANVVSSMKALLAAGERLQISLKPENQRRSANLSAVTSHDLTPELAADVKALWADPGVQQVFARSAEFQLNDSAQYYFESVDRLADPNFTPTDDDILHSRAKTTGITETVFDVSGVHFRMVDVGGQRSERKKWIHCFQDVTAVVFCVALSEYNLRLYEDETVNRMHESIKLFDEICNSRWFLSTSIVLFLNKSDLFRKKIEQDKVDLKVCFPEYTGGCDYEKGWMYIRDKFVELNHNPQSKHVFPHVTCATDTNNIRFIFNAVRDIILHKVLDQSGF